MQMSYRCIAILSVCVSFGSAAAQGGPHKASPASAVVATSGGYQLTDDMIEQALRFGQILAGTEFSASDVAALKGDLIATFQKEPAKQIATYDSVAKTLRKALSRKPSWLDLAVFRYRAWQSFANDPQNFRDFESYPFGQMVLKYNPVLVNSGGMVVTKTDIDCQFYADNLVAEIAGVAPPAQEDRDQFVSDIASQFASMPKQQQEYLTLAELRLVSLRMVYDGTVKARAAVVADIRKRVHSTEDVWREARQVENDVQSGAKYHQLYRTEVGAALGHGLHVYNQILGTGAIMHTWSNSLRGRLFWR